MNNQCIQEEDESIFYKIATEEFNSFVELQNKYCSFVAAYDELMSHEFIKDIQEIFNINYCEYKYELPISTLYRARLVTDTNGIGKSEQFLGYDEKGSFVPPPNKCKAGRLNVAHVPYLYVSEDSDTAILEVRPRFQEEISVAEIEINKPLNMLALTNRYNTKNQNYKAEAIKHLIDNKLSIPSSRYYEELEYRPLQFIANVIRNMGYDGIVYRSAMNIDTLNYCIFNYEHCKAVSSQIAIFTSADISSLIKYSRLETPKENNQ